MIGISTQLVALNYFKTALSPRPKRPTKEAKKANI